MINLKLELFNFKKNLDFESQEDIAQIVESHYNNIDNFSEKQVVKSLTERLSIHTYDNNVKSLLENLNSDLQENELKYNLKDLYKLIEQKNQGMIYRQALNTLLEIINTEDDSDVKNKILNELALHDWVPEIKVFMHNLHSNPDKKQNLMNGGDSSTVFAIVEKVEDGHIALVDNVWFHISEDNIDKTLLENHVEDEHKRATLRQLQTALQYSEITENRVDFKLDENLTIGISTESNETFINEDKVEEETSVESLFNSPIVPLAKKTFFPLIKSIKENKDKIVDLDISRHITNVGNPFVECFVFNHDGNMFLYRKDSRQGTSFYKYESATDLINDVRNDLQYDLTYFFENVLDKEVMKQRKLEDKVREIQVSLDEIDTNKEKVKANVEMLGESEVLSKALSILEKKHQEKMSDLNATKRVLNDMREKSLIK